MDGNKSNLISNNSSSNPSLSNNYHYPHLPYPSPSTPFSSYYLSPTGILSERTNGGAEDSGFPTHGFTPGIDPSEFTDANAKPAEPELDGHGSESEDGVGFSDEPAKHNTHRGSGSKRSRAAEVHNLSEKRRRSRINEKMKALQNLIPNSNKTDKASMLDEAIEYLKQLQLQVQMLSMRNGLNLHPMYMPAGVLQPLQSSEFNMGFTVDNRSTMNMGVGALHLNIDSSARTSYGLSDRCTSSHPPIILPHMPSMNTTGTSFGMESSQSHHGPFQLPVDTELFTEGMVSERQLDSGHNTRHLQEDEIKSVAASLNLDGSVLGRERSEDMRSKDYTDNHIFTQHLNGFASGDRKPGSPEF